VNQESPVFRRGSVNNVLLTESILVFAVLELPTGINKENLIVFCGSIEKDQYRWDARAKKEIRRQANHPI
jgi:hypothetical protein